MRLKETEQSYPNFLYSILSKISMLSKLQRSVLATLSHKDAENQ